MNKKIKRSFLILIFICICILIGYRISFKNEKSSNTYDINQNLKKEKGVKDSSIHLKGDEVIGNILVEDNMSKQDAEIILNKYIKSLKDSYSNKLISIEVKKANKKFIIREKVSQHDNELYGEMKSFMNTKYIEIKTRDINENKIKQIVLNGKVIEKNKDYSISENVLKIIVDDYKCKISILVGDKDYKVIVF